VQCQKEKQDGSQCQARAMSGKKYCSLHSEPGKAAELGRKGGRRRTVYCPDALKEFSAPKSAADLRDLLAQSIVEIRGEPGNWTQSWPIRSAISGPASSALLRFPIWRVVWQRLRGEGSRAMATLRSRIEQLEERNWQELLERLDRYLEGRSLEDREFFCVHGYLPEVPIPGPPVDTSAWRRPKWKEHKRALAGRSEEEYEFFCVHGYWPRRSRSLNDSNG